jgi:cation/acetate symporter
MSFRRRLQTVPGLHVCFLLFLLGMGMLERWGVPHQYIGFIFLAAPLVIYAVVGVLGRTDPSEYYVAGRRVPASTTAWPPGPTG